MTELDVYLDDLSSRLHVGRRERTRILTEVRDHLDDSVTHNEASGAPHSEAVVRALDTFGSPATLAANFNAASGTRAMRRAPIIALAAGLTVLAGFLLAGTTQTHSTTPANAILATQISFFLAVLSFQVAVVAGICGGSRALALWRAPIARGTDRLFVRRASLVSVCALGVAALAWAATMCLAFDSLTDPNSFTLLCGGIVMLAGAGIGFAATRRLQVNGSHDAYGAHGAPDAFLGLGERCIGFIRRHPVVACVAVATLSIYPATSHAETTLSGALPWGLTQGASVVVGFVVFGRALELRPSGTTDFTT